MVLSLFPTIAFLVIYRITINFTNLPYPANSRHTNPQRQATIDRRITEDIDRLLKNIPGQHKIKLLPYRLLHFL